MIVSSQDGTTNSSSRLYRQFTPSPQRALPLDHLERKGPLQVTIRLQSNPSEYSQGTLCLEGQTSTLDTSSQRTCEGITRSLTPNQFPISWDVALNGFRKHLSGREMRHRNSPLQLDLYLQTPRVPRIYFCCSNYFLFSVGC